MTQAKAVSTTSRRDVLSALTGLMVLGTTTVGIARHALEEAAADPLGDLILTAEDPLIELIARYRAGLAAYNTAEGYDEVHSDYDELAERTYAPAFDEIREHCPPAQTFAGAMAAIALAEDELRDTFSPLCLPLIQAARAYLVASEG